MSGATCGNGDCTRLANGTDGYGWCMYCEDDSDNALLPTTASHRSWTKTILHVCRTGAKEQFYTLYVERKGSPEPFAFYHYCSFVQNLAHKESEATEKAVKFAQERFVKACANGTCEVQIHPEPRPIYRNFTAFGSVEMKMAKKRNVWWGHANEDFWNKWKTDKQSIKDAGYWVKRTQEGNWLVFKRVDPAIIEWRDE